MGSSTGGRGKKKKKQGAHVRRGSVHHHERPKLKDNPAPPQVGGGTTTGLPTNVERLRSARTDFLNRLSDEAEEPEDPTMAHTTTTTRSVVETRSRPKRSETQREHRHHHRRDGSRRRSRSRERRSRRGTESTQRPLADHREWVTAAGIDGSGRLRHTESDVGVRRAHSTRVPPRTAEPRVESGLGRRRSVAAPTSVQAAPKTSGSSTVRSRATSDSRRPPLSRSATMLEPTPGTRPPMRRSNTSRGRASSMHMAFGGSSADARDTASEATRNRRRSGGLLSAIFAMPRPPPRVPSGPEKQVECLTCMADDIPISKSAKLTCGHIMCHDCLKRIFELSITDPQHMPPKCCTPDHIPLKHVDKLFSDKFKQRWNRKYQEFTTKNRIYCPNRGCGDWIKPSHIHRDERGRKYAKCSHCKTKVCTMCNGKWHIKKDCPKDEETNRFVEFAKREGWQRCHSCSAMVELKEGCNHMTCRCTAEFCMICGAKWKTCDCPWFNQPQVMAHERLMNFNVPVQVQYPFRVVRHQQQPLPYNGARAPANAAPQPRGYNEELERRRRQEQRDEAIARRLQVLGMDDDDDFVRGGGPADFYGVGNGQGHLMNENYVRLAGDILDGAFNQARAGMGEGNRRAAGPTRDRPLDPFLYEVLEPAARVQQARQPLPDREDNTPLRLHTVASRTYNAAPGTRPAERVVPRRTRTDYATEFARHMPVAQRNEPARAVPRATNAPRPANDARRHSLMAGLVGSNRAEGGRVGAWLRHVEDGLPPAEEGRAPV